jgi:predicted nuclease of predicted toxin-antitoxin system
MKLRFQADNDLDQRIVTAVRRLGPTVDFQTASALGLHGLSDPEVLALAAQEDRVLVSHDKKTLPDHFSAFIASQDSPGVLLVSRRLAIGKAAEWLYLLWAASEAEEYVNVIYRLP